MSVAGAHPDAPPTPAGHYRLTLDDESAADPTIVGGKAAALARVRRAGITTLPGVVLTSRFSAAVDAGADVHSVPALDAAVRSAFRDARALLDPPATSLLVRSSSVVEDQPASSAAGQFESVAGVDTIDEFRDAVSTVLRSREAAGASNEPIGVLVQPQITPDVGGVVFGVEPVTGRTDRHTIAAVQGRPDLLVGGDVDGTTYVTDCDGSVIESTIRDGLELDTATIRDLVDVAGRLAHVFDAPQDIEWAQVDGSLIVLQSRPVTTPIRGVPVGPLYGPGTVGETFPDPLTTLERDLWVAPLDEAIRATLVLSGRHTEDELAGRPLVVTVGGRVALDLEMTGDGATGDDDRGWFTRRVRRLRNAWRLGRLRAALPSLVDDLLVVVDGDLADVPSLDAISTRRAMALLHRSHAALRSVHAHEVLVGALSGSSESSLTSASVASRVLDEGRREGLADADIVERAPVVLALVPPRVGSSTQLPRQLLAPTWDRAPDANATETRREALRLRVRWIHELTARVASELGERLARRGELPDADSIRHLPLDDLDAIFGGRARIWWAALDRARTSPPSDPLPARFRLGDRGLPIPQAGTDGHAVGASPGVAAGVVVHLGDGVDDEIDAARREGEGAILVVHALSPDLGGRLGSLAGIVSETGSTLSHLAILAREHGVPAVVGHGGAVDRLDPGSRVRIDGADGTVELLDDSGSGEHGRPGAQRTEQAPS